QVVEQPIQVVPLRPAQRLGPLDDQVAAAEHERRLVPGGRPAAAGALAPPAALAAGVAAPRQAPPQAAHRPQDLVVELPQQVHHPNAIELRATLVIPYASTARPSIPRRPRRP